MLPEVSYFHQEVTKKRELVLQCVTDGDFISIFLMKEFIANKETTSVIRLYAKNM